MKEIRTITKCGQVKKLLEKRIKHFSPHQSLSSEPRLAKEYNVSRFTVSKAISELSAEGLLYRIQGKGTFLSPKKPLQRTGLIGILARELDKPYIWGEVARTVEEEVYKTGGNLLLGHTDNSYQRFKKYIQLYQERKVDGLIIAPLMTEKKYEEINLNLLRQIEKASISYVLIDGYLENYPTDCVIINNEEMGYSLTRHLLEQGYRRIAFISTPYCSSAKDRLNGYKKALEEVGISCDEKLISFSKARFEKDAYLLAKNLLAKQKPDAFFGVNDVFAYGAFKAIEEAGLNVPKDIGLVGFDDSTIAYKLKVPLTTVRQPREEIGEKAIQLLRKRIEKPDKKAERIVLSAKLIIRESSVRKN
ncbi:MAG: GntR family transcriptional regulator [bacterium]